MRLDQYLVQTDCFESRNKAAAAIKAGDISVNGAVIVKPSYEVPDHADVRHLGAKSYVARSAQKLLHAFSVFELNWSGFTVADLGASTGGFCQVLLENGAQRVYAVDVGTAQLHPSVAADPRIVNMEKTNARTLTAASFPGPVQAVTADLSFISVRLILPAVHAILPRGGEAVLLIKPQFEAGKQALSKSGVVTDRRAHKAVLVTICAEAQALGFSVKGISFSGLAGESGNREYLLYLLHESDSSINAESAIDRAIETEATYE